MVTLWTNCLSAALAMFPFIFIPREFSMLWNCNTSQSHKGGQSEDLLLKKMCSWFSLKVDVPDEASFFSKISEGPKSADELVFPNWTISLMKKSAKPSFSPSTTDPDGESSYRTAHFFRAGYFQTAGQPRKKRLPMKEPWCGSSRYKSGFLYHHQSLNSNSRSCECCVGLPPAHLNEGDETTTLFLSELVFPKSDLDFVTDPARKKAPCRCWLTIMRWQAHHMLLLTPLATSFFCVLLRQDCTWHKSLCTVLIAHRRPLEQTFLTPFKKKSDFCLRLWLIALLWSG